MKYIKAVILMVLISFFMSGCGNEIKMTSSSLEYEGKNYDDVVDELRKKGFCNIEAEMLEDLSSKDVARDGYVEKIIIDGSSSFEKGEAFTPEAEVVICYHVIRKVKPPISSDELQNRDYEAIGNAFKDAGFTNVNVEEIYDLDPDSIETDYVNEVQIGDITAFNVDEGFPYDVNISVFCHRPFDKYTVLLHVECERNLIFSKYNIDIWIDDEKRELLKHGDKKDYEFRLEAGEHTFTFTEEDSAAVSGAEKVEISSDMEIAYKLSCFSDKVKAETLYVDRKVNLGENEAKMECSAAEYKNKNYKEIISSLEKAGFTNIKTNIMYDIVWGITEEGESDQVTVEGKSDFKKGEIYAKDAEIIVTYHMREEDRDYFCVSIDQL